MSSPQPLSDQELENRFGFHKATVEGPDATKPKHAELRVLFLGFARHLNFVLFPNRNTSLALTALEEASMWAHKSIAQYAPLEETHTEETLHKVYGVLVDDGTIDGEQARQLILQMQNKGILFRELTRE